MACSNKMKSIYEATHLKYLSFFQNSVISFVDNEISASVLCDDRIFDYTAPALCQNKKYLSKGNSVF